MFPLQLYISTMIGAAIDYSGSVAENLLDYQHQVFKILSCLEGPIHIMLWSDRVYQSICEKINQLSDIFANRFPDGCTESRKFVNILPTEKPITLYIFTDGKLINHDVECSKWYLENMKNLQLQHVHLHYIGKKDDMNLKFTNVFQNYPIDIYISGESIAHVQNFHIDLSSFEFDSVLKDDSLKAIVITRLNDPTTNKIELKRKVQQLQTRLLAERFQELTIQSFYEHRDVEGCCKYIREHSTYYTEKSKFQQKMSDILNLFDKHDNTYQLSVFKELSAPTELDLENVTLEEVKEEDRQYLTCDILYNICDCACIPVKAYEGCWPEKKMIQNPFLLLESENWIQRIVSQVEPFVLDVTTYKRLRTPHISPFSRDYLKGVYILHHSKLNEKERIRHNNYILSTFFQNKLPGKAILWHIIFLYIVGMQRFQDYRDVFFKEIQYLGEQEKYFVTLHPQRNPPIVENLNVCFWYIACVCPFLYPNSKANVLRSPDFVSGVILDFYRNVYDPIYVRPKRMLAWQTWYELCHAKNFTKKEVIFSMLSRYFRHKKISEDNFGILLFREKTHESQDDLDTILNTYSTFLKYNNPDFYENLNDLPPANFQLFDHVDEEEDKLQHVRINLKTCHPYVRCLTSGQHWKTCIGNYDREKQSYLRLFRRYCIKNGKYPEKAEDLMIYLNEYLFHCKNKVPELMESALEDHMKQVMDIFKEVMETYECKDYIKISRKMCSEEIRLQYE